MPNDHIACGTANRLGTKSMQILLLWVGMGRKLRQPLSDSFVKPWHNRQCTLFGWCIRIRANLSHK